MPTSASLSYLPLPISPKHLGEKESVERPGVGQLQKCASVQSCFTYLLTLGLHTALQAHFQQVNVSFHLVPISEKGRLENEAHSAGSNSFHFCSLSPRLKALPAQLFPMVSPRALFLPLQEELNKDNNDHHNDSNSKYTVD